MRKQPTGYVAGTWLASCDRCGFNYRNTDLRLEWHPEALLPLLSGFFAFNAFGILWYVIPPAAVMFLTNGDRRQRLLFLWSGLVLLQILVIYLFTPNAEGIINGQGFFRQALVPGILGILACAVSIRPQRIPSASS